MTRGMGQRAWGKGHGERHPASGIADGPTLLERPGRKAYLQPMMRFFDMDDRARLPWRFFGATISILARA